jgi:thymidylate synthase (FAD)
MNETKILDNGHVRLIDWMGNDLSIARNARVSYDAEWRAGEDKGSDARLIKYLWKNGHTSPFESCTVTFDVKAPIFVLRQWHRHRTQSYNEVSARYTELPSEFYLPDIEQITTQSTDNKQMRTEEVHKNAEELRQLIRISNEGSLAVYQKLIEEGCPRELARSVIPVGTYSHMFATANLLNWLKFLKERLHPHAQYEIRVYAEAIRDYLRVLYPTTMEVFDEFNTVR